MPKMNPSNGSKVSNRHVLQVSKRLFQVLISVATILSVVSFIVRLRVILVGKDTFLWEALFFFFDADTEYNLPS